LNQRQSRPLSRDGGSSGRFLIVTADDFGAAPEVNDAVEIGHRQGVLTAASLMVAAPAAAEAVTLAKALPSLAVGLHLVLVEGRPVLSPADIPDLVDAQGRFRAGMAAAGARMFFLPAVRRQLEAEITAQFETFVATGLPLDHANAHKHFHLHPTIAELILKIGARHGLRAARAPVEPRGPPLLTAGARLLRRRLRAAGLIVPDQVFGSRHSGAMTGARLTAILAALPPGLTEIYLHPATAGGFDGAAAGYRYAEELAGLTSPEAMRAAGDTSRGGFAASVDAIRTPSASRPLPGWRAGAPGTR
jgi:chitin disaccharide deacetylase